MGAELTDGGRKPRVTEDEILEVLATATDPVLSTAEIADALPIKRRGTLNRLRALEEAGDVASKQIGGRNTVWWLPRDQPDATGGRVAGEEPPTTDESVPPGQEEGRREEASAAPGELSAVEFPGGRSRDECETAVYAARDYLREHGSASMREIVTEVMPDHSLGYDVPDLEPGDRYRGSWWRKVVKPGLKALDGVAAPAGGGKWRYTGDVDA